MKKQIKIIVSSLLMLGLALVQPARADYVGELETTKYFDQATIDLFKSKIASGQSLTSADEISYFIQFTPTNNGGFIGGGGFVTDYIPAGMQVTNAQFVRLDSSAAGFTQIAPPGVAAVLPAYVPEYSETGIFYSTDARTAVFPATPGATITTANGKALAAGTGCGGISLPSTTHNLWDSAMQTKYAAAARNTTGTCLVPPVINYSIMGASPVAGPDALLQLDSAGVVGPWQRIAYPGSMKGTMTGVAAYGSTNKCIGGTPIASGYNLSATNPLPPNTNAVRFAAGKVTVGELFTVRISMKPTASMPVGGLVNNTEVFGGDASLDPGSTAGKDNHWKYHCPAVAVSNSSLVLIKTLVGACSGVGCIPTPVTAGVVPSVINLKLRYTIQYLNLGSTPQTNVVIKDTFATAAAYVAGSATQLSGAVLGAPTAAGAPVVLTFPTIGSLAAGAGGTVQYDVNYVSAPAANSALINTANMTSTQVPAPGVTSKSIATATSLGNLWITKATTTPSVSPGNAVNYTVSIPNNGGAAVTATAALPITVNDFLPTSGAGMLAANRFSYTTGSVLAQTWTAAGVPTTVVPTVTVVVPATATASEQVTFKFGAGTSIPVGGKLTISYSAIAGASVPASAVPYLSDVNVWYSGGPGGGALNSSYSEDVGTAPVKVIAPMSLTVKIDCVYAGATCTPFTNGTIPPGAKVRYRMDYKNISGATLNALTLTNTLPANITYVTGTASQNGTSIANPTIAGQVLTFPTLGSLVSNVTGYVSFDAQLGAAVVDGMDITDTAKLTASTFTAGVTASVTHAVRNQAELVVTKTVSPASVASNGTVTYTVTVTNIGSVNASNIKIYDELPYTGTTVDPLARFNYVAAGTFTLNDAVTPVGKQITATTPTFSRPPTFTGYIANTNQQEVKWDFASAGAHANDYLSPGGSFTFTYTATANVPSSATAYESEVIAEYISATVPPSSIQHDYSGKTAPVIVGGLDHIRLLHNGSGLTCMPETLTVQACSDAACATPFTGAVTTTVNGVTPAITFSGGSSTVDLAVITAGNFTVGASNTSPTPQNITRCFNGVTETCTLSFADAGFILSSVADGAEVLIPEQVAGIASASYVLRAVKADKSTKACTSALTGTQTVNFGYECNDPTSCAAGNLMSVNGTPVVANNNNPFLGFSYTGISLTFDANGNTTSPISLVYEDVGQVTLRVQKAVNSKDVLGNTNAFIVKPHHFAVDVCTAATPGDCALNTPATATNGAGGILAIAGTASTQTGAAFKATVRSMSANNNVTPSFGSAGSANAGTSHTTETVALTHACVAPLIAGACPVAGILNGTKSVTRSVFTDGVATVSDLTWSEVGVITLTATNNTFMGAASIATGTSANAGRFKPDHFDTAVNGTLGCASPSPFATCPAGGMVYSGQKFAGVAVTSKNAAGGTTSNYQDVFAKVVALSAVASAGGGAVASGTLTAPNLTASTFANGVASASVAGANLPLFTLASLNPLDVYLRALDADNVSSLRAAAANSVEGGLKVVTGRIKIGNAYGSEKLDLTMPVTVQFYDGSLWRTSTTDSGTQINTNKTAIGNIGIAGLAVNIKTPGVKTVSGGGLTDFKLAAPNVAGKSVVSIVSTAANNLDYLLTNLIAGEATFGVYKGANEFIYLRESY